MNRYRISTLVTIDINAENEDDARDAVYSGLDNIEGVREPIMQTCEVVEVPYVLPMGAERWGACARAVRLDEDGCNGQRRFGMLDGSWWWTDGHCALRCEGSPPEVGDDWRRIEDGAFAKVLDTHERRSTLWGHKVADGSMVGRRAFAHPDVAIQQKYHALVVDSVPGARWMVGGPRHAVHGLDREGRLMAVVMPFIADGLPALDLGDAPTPSKTDGDVCSAEGETMSGCIEHESGRAYGCKACDAKGAADNACAAQGSNTTTTTKENESGEGLQRQGREVRAGHDPAPSDGRQHERGGLSQRPERVSEGVGEGHLERPEEGDRAVQSVAQGAGTAVAEWAHDVKEGAAESRGSAAPSSSVEEPSCRCGMYVGECPKHNARYHDAVYEALVQKRIQGAVADERKRCARVCEDVARTIGALPLSSIHTALMNAKLAIEQPDLLKGGAE